MRRALTALTLMAATFAAPASAEEPGFAAVLACKSVADPLERVACYDAAVGRLEAAEAAGDVKVITRADVEQVKRDSFGFRIPSLPAFGGGSGKSEALERVTEAVSSVSGSKGQLRVTLANGQVWEQIDDKPARAKSPKSAEIHQAALGSFKMKLDGGLAFRVRRVN